jgi:hypothetical protein
MIRLRYRSTLVLAALTVVLLLLSFAGTLACNQAQHKPQAAAMAGAPPELNTVFGDPGIVIVWDALEHVRSADIVQYLVWRDGTPVCAADSRTAPSFTGPNGRWDHSCIDVPLGRAFIFYCVDPSGQLANMIATVPAVPVGTQHQYWVTCIYRQVMRNGKVVYQSTTQVAAGKATFLNRPVPVSPGGMTSVGPDLSSVTFQWQGCAGADSYVIEVSTKPSFRRNKTWVGEVFMPTLHDGMPCAQTYTSVLSKARELKRVAPGATLYWRVGARNRSDNPGPLAAGPSPKADGEKDTCYIYNDPAQTQTFTTGDDGGGNPPPPPPPPPGGGGDNPPPPPGI